MKYILLLLLVSLAHAQPYEPTFLLDVTGEVGQAIGRFNLQTLGDQNGDGFDDFLTSVDDPNDNSALRIYWGSAGPAEFIDFGRFDTTGREFGWVDAAYDAGFTVPAGDFDGDGHGDILRELCVWYDGQCHLYPYLFLGGPGVFDTLADWTGNLTDMRFTTNVGDYNGDGKDDFTKKTLNTGSFGFYLGGFPII
ncbi:MAG: hypothetical protein IPG71_10690 [bacterium]|nr:hypothetical protein [bacterium]